MKYLVIMVALCLTAPLAQAGQVRNIELKELQTKIGLVVDEASISRTDELGRPAENICSVVLNTINLTKNVTLARTARHTGLRLTAGRWCMMNPLEDLIDIVRRGSQGAIATIRLIESRYEVTPAHGEPENVGKCNRSLIEKVEIVLPLGRKVSFFEETRLGTTTLEECFR